ncbi:hypothetical protein H0E87_010015 [Populus deltoides]|uniref:Uncharacterized protein n=1 Tax=Populus deltoides TaxID=3696 RepID=A0A8T2YR36_POPDE|nr:hypothetical protein H0E87_010015 [Populus deltoides]
MEKPLPFAHTQVFGQHVQQLTWPCSPADLQNHSMDVKQFLCNFKKQMNFQAGFNNRAFMCQRARDNDIGVGTGQHISKSVRSITVANPGECKVVKEMLLENQSQVERQECYLWREHRCH